MKNAQKHNERIIEQFSKQAVPFAKKVSAHSNTAAFNLIIKTIGITKKDHVLDVACGPGMLSCAVAQKSGYVTGIDLVPAMIRQARLLQRQKELSNVHWQTGDVTQLPFDDGSFSAVLTRFSFHHFLNPQTVLNEMARVARPQGRVAVIDVFAKSGVHARMHDCLEQLRDDSHVRIFSVAELEGMMKKAGLILRDIRFYDLEIELEQQIAASFPKAGGVAKIRKLVEGDTKGLISSCKGGKKYLFYPIAILVGEKQL